MKEKTDAYANSKWKEKLMRMQIPILGIRETPGSAWGEDWVERVKALAPDRICSVTRESRILGVK